MAYLEKYYLEDINNENNTFVPFDDENGVGGTGPNKPIGAGTGGSSTTLNGNDNTPNKDITPEGDKDKSTKLGNNVETIDEYTIKILAELLEGKGGATVYVNSNPLPNITPQEYKVKLTDLFTQGPQTIEVRKAGYASNQKYILDVIGSGDNVITDITLLEDEVSRQTLGVNKLSLRIRYYEDNVEKPYNELRNGTLKQISFILAKSPTKPVDPKTNELNINLKGPSSSVQILFNNQSELIDEGTTTYKDTTGAKYTLKSPNTTLYRISEVVITDLDGKSEVLTAGKSESISMEINLNRNLKVDVLSHRVVKQQVSKPKIRLKGAATQKYNINEKVDIPLVVEKNDDVRAISMVIGNEILEFDNLKQGKYAGIKIPHRLIDKIGNYKIKLFPYSISELQKGQKERNEKELPPPPPPKTNPNIVKETPVVRDTQKESDTSLPPVKKDKYLPPTPVRPTNNVIINGAPNNDSDTGFSRQPGGRS